jgi:O-6-methylguanine DNA methyltransferase
VHFFAFILLFSPEFIIFAPFLHKVSAKHTANSDNSSSSSKCSRKRAVGQAVGRNPIALIIPCHRVVGANGTLGGYVYGLNRKKQLLELEKEMDKMAEDGQFGTKDGHIGRDFRVGT